MAGQERFQERRPKTIVNVRSLEPGTKVRLVGEATAEVVSNPQDGIWVLVRYLAARGNPSQVGTEELAFAEDILEVLEAPDL